MDAKEKETQNNKNPLQRLKEGLDDKEEQLQVLSTFVRLGVVVWSGFILFWCLVVLSLGYVKLPTRMFGMDIPDQPRIDSTFAAGLLGNILAGWGISVGANNGKKKKKESEGSGAIPTAGGYQTIIVKQPLELIAKQAEVQRVDPITNRPVGGDGKLQ